jgi:RNA polymerase sigma factor (sigma-70 family)
VLRHKDKLYTSILFLVKDKYLAEDIFQESFIRIIDTMRNGRYTEEGKFLPWAMRIAHNLCVDHFRKVKRTPRSTVGSMTEVYDYLRLLFARIGRTYSPVSGREVKKDDVNDVINTIRQLPAGSKVYILIKFKQHRNREIKEELSILLQKGFSRIYISSQPSTDGDEVIHRIEELLELSDKDLELKLSGAGNSNDSSLANSNKSKSIK